MKNLLRIFAYIGIAWAGWGTLFVVGFLICSTENPLLAILGVLNGLLFFPFYYLLARLDNLPFYINGKNIARRKRSKKR